MNRAKYWLSMAGMALAVVGVATENRYVVWAAIVVLALAVAVRLLLRRRRSDQPPEPNP